MSHLRNRTESVLRLLRRFLRSTSGQDLVEYALLAGFVAVGAGALIPYGVAEPIMKIFNSLIEVLRSIGGAG